jgi:hypothetical protein
MDASGVDVDIDVGAGRDLQTAADLRGDSTVALHPLLIPTDHGIGPVLSAGRASWVELADEGGATAMDFW